MKQAAQPPAAPAPDGAELLRTAGHLPVMVVTVEGGTIVDVRVATRDFIMANLAVGAATHMGGNSCNASAGRSPSSSA